MATQQPFNELARQRRAAHAAKQHHDILLMVSRGDIGALAMARDKLGVNLSRNRQIGKNGMGRIVTPLIYAMETGQRGVFNWLVSQRLWLDHVSTVRLPLNIGFDNGTALDAAYQARNPDFVRALIGNGASNVLWPQHENQLQQDVARYRTNHAAAQYKR